MNDAELTRLIQQDRQAPLPESPDPRWIAARVRTRLPASPKRVELGATEILLLVLSILGAMIPTAWALFTNRPAWLLLWPVLLLITAPLLGKNGANQS